MRFAILVLFAFCCAVSNADEVAERDAAKRESGDAFRASDYAELERLASEYRSEETRTSSGTWHLSLFYKGIAEYGLKFANDEQSGWRKALAKFDEWKETYPSSSTPHIAYAAALMGRAWYVRGAGYSRGVTSDQMAVYNALAAEAGEYLGSHSDLSEADPHWFYIMADVFRALGVEKEYFRQLVEDGLDRYPNYDDILFVAGSYYARIWYGSDEELETFARMAVEKTKSERGLAVYPRVYWVAGKISPEHYAFQSSSAVWDDMVAGMDAVIERYPSQWNIQHFAFFACWARDANTTEKYLDLIERPLVAEAGMTEKNLTTCRSMIEYYQRRVE